MADDSFHVPMLCENIYGHRKKLMFFVQELRKRSIARPQDGLRLRVLDFGCGNGEAIGRHIVHLDIDYLGVDIHETSLAHARKVVSGDNVRFLKSVPKHETFDIILYGDVLEHLEDPREIVTYHSKFLSEDGCMIGAVPNGYGLFEIESAIERRFDLYTKYQAARTWYYQQRHKIAKWIKINILGRQSVPSVPLDLPTPFNHDSGHIQFFRRPDVEQMLNDAGLREVYFRNGVFMGAPLSGSLLGDFTSVLVLNSKVADWLPARMVANWYFIAERG
tara:strand:+ start:32863 stop:33690 length:828 start_codon:yes stop_codon:yes gene_type:complete